MSEHVDISVPVGEPYKEMFNDLVENGELEDHEVRQQLAQALVKPTRDIIHNSYSAELQDQGE